MSIKIVTLIAALALGGCQTLEQRAQTRSKLVCFQAGFGETSPRHEECLRTMVPVAIETERQRSFDDIETGLALIAASRRR